MKFLRSIFVWDPPVFAGWELTIMRVLFAGLLLNFFSNGWWNFLPELLTSPAEGFRHIFLFPPPTVTSQPHPHGIANWFDLSFIRGDMFPVLRGLLLVSIGLYAAGLVLPLSLGYILWFMVCLVSLRLSQGYTGHSGQVVGLGVLAQWLGCLAGPLWKREPGWWRAWLLSRGVDFALPARLTREAVVAAYVVAGVTKLIASRGRWLSEAPNFVLQMQKASDETWYSLAFRPNGEGVQAWLLAHPWACMLFLLPGLLLEQAAFLMLFNRRMSALFALGLVSFHLVLAYLMNLSFLQNQVALWVYFINVPGWLVLWLRERGSQPERS